MKYFTFFFICILFMIVTSHAANDSHCYSIKNADQKNFCIALVKKYGSYCYNISESDSKHMCLAQIKNQKSYCYSIQSHDVKNHCLALLK
jgi:hypothetical protein